MLQSRVTAMLMVFTCGLSVGARAADDAWSYNVAPYLWFSGLKGDAATLPGAPPTHIDASFNDILDQLDMALMVAGEARKGAYSIWGDLMYTSLSVDGVVTLPAGIPIDVDYENDLLVMTVGGAYRLVDSGGTFLDAVAGVRYWNLDNTLKLSVPVAPYPALNVSDDKDWLDPMLGLKGRADLGSNWFLNGWALAAVGGDSDTSWDIFSGIGYTYSDTTSVVVGYRHLAVDFDDNGFLFDVEQSGPMLGGSFRF